jgi:hypothetical protein
LERRYRDLGFEAEWVLYQTSSDRNVEGVIMRVVFLDIDGVLNSDPFLSESCQGRFVPHGDIIDRIAVGFLNEIVEKSGAKIVISSSWRNGFKWDALVDLLRIVGVKGDIIDKTPRTFSYLPRGAEIAKWLSENPVDGMVCLDDALDMTVVEPWTVRTDFAEGLVQRHVELALAVLESRPYCGK